MVNLEHLTIEELEFKRKVLDRQIKLLRKEWWQCSYKRDTEKKLCMLLKQYCSVVRMIIKKRQRERQRKRQATKCKTK